MPVADQQHSEKRLALTDRYGVTLQNKQSVTPYLSVF